MSQPRTIGLPQSAQQMTLGQFIEQLSHVEPTKQVMLDFGDVLKGETQLFDCYEQHPDELAISHRLPMNDDRMTDADIVMMRATDANGCTFISSDGAEHLMDEDTPLWVANWRIPSGNAVIAVEETADLVIVRTWRIE